MSDVDIISAMRRKAGVGRPPPEVQPMSPAKALRIAVAKAAEEAIGLVAQVTDVVEERSAILRLSGQVPEHALLALLEGPNSAYGLAVFDKNVVSAIVEQQTTGKVLNLPPEDRSPTATDAVMCTDLCDQLLRQFETHVAEIDNPPEVAGFHLAAQLREARSITIAFDDVPYRLYRISMMLGRGDRTGEILLVFPYASPKPKSTEPDTSGDFGSAFQNVILKSEARLDTVLHRVRLTLEDVTALTEGMMIPIPREALSRVELRADGRLVSRARLGQINGKRALRVVLANGGEDLLPEADGTGEAVFDGLTDSVTPAGFLALSEGDMPMPPMGELPPLGDLPPLEGGSDGAEAGFPSLSDLPPLE